jgi:hypothetical protein
MYPPTPAGPDMSRAQGDRSALHAPVVRLHKVTLSQTLSSPADLAPCYDDRQHFANAARITAYESSDNAVRRWVVGPVSTQRVQ